MQQIQVTGHLGKDAIIRVSNGKEFLTFNVCATDGYKNQAGERVETSTWYSCSYQKTALAPYLKKGDKIMVQGELKAKIYLNDRRESQLDLSVSVTRVELFTKKVEAETEE